MYKVIFISIFLLFLFQSIGLFAQDNTLAQKALSKVKEEYEDNIYLRLRIFQRNTNSEIFIKGWKVENAFKRLYNFEKEKQNIYPYQTDPAFELNLKKKYFKYKDIYLVSFLFSFGNYEKTFGFYWWVDPKHGLMMDISNNKKLCQKYHLLMYPQLYRSTLKLVPYKNEIQSMLNE